MSRQVHRFWAVLTCISILASGCTPSQPFYFFEDGDLSHYKGVATEIEYPDVEVNSLAEVDGAMPPLTLRNSEAREIWDLPLQDAVQYALQNSRVMRTLGGQVQATPGNLLRTPDIIPTVYDPAIVESNPRTGVEGALAAFDTQLSAGVSWERNERPVNIAGGIAEEIFAPEFIQDLGTFQSQLSKTTATGGQFAVRHNAIYEFNNNPTRAVPSDWNVNLEALFTQPLLQGAGVTFNRIAGPGFQPGLFFGNGVILARINQDIALADFEAGVRNLVSEVETAYWELYFAYRQLDAVVAGRDSALQTWRRVYALAVTGAIGGEAEKEAQAREQYFLFQAQVEQALSNVYSVESRLRYIMGLTATDGRLIRPADEPTHALVNFDWYETHAEGLARSVELRRQKWRIKQREYELIAARNFLLPRLDATGRYRWLGLGDRLIDPDGATTVGFEGSNAWEVLTGGDYQEWQLGLQFQMPIGFRRELANVRNAQLQLARDRAVLQDQELELSHQLADAIRQLDQAYTLTHWNFNRRVAAERQVEAVRAAYEVAQVTLDVLLNAQRQLADAEAQYYRSLVDYNLAIMTVHLRKGSLLEYNGVLLAEGPWPGKAYFDARKRARERDAAIYMDYGFTYPRVISRGPLAQQLHTDVGLFDGNGPTPAAEEVPVPQTEPTDEPSLPLGPPAPPDEGSTRRTSPTPAARPGAVDSAAQPFEWGSLGLTSATPSQPATTTTSAAAPPATMAPAPAPGSAAATAVRPVNFQQQWSSASRHENDSHSTPARLDGSAAEWKGSN